MYETFSGTPVTGRPCRLVARGTRVLHRDRARPQPASSATRGVFQAARPARRWSAALATACRSRAGRRLHVDRHDRGRAGRPGHRHHPPRGRHPDALPDRSPAAGRRRAAARAPSSPWPAPGLRAAAGRRASARSSTTAQLGIELAAPWLVASLGAGLHGHLDRRPARPPGSRATRRPTSPRAGCSPSCARSTRRLSSGLDPVDIGAEVAGRPARTRSAARAARSSSTATGGACSRWCTAGATRGSPIAPRARSSTPAVETLEPQQSPQPSGLAERRHRIVLPLRLGGRLIGVVVAEAGIAATDASLRRRCCDALDERALRLDTALVFDEVRALATRRGAAAAGPRDPRRRRPGDRVAGLPRRRPRRRRRQRPPAQPSCTACAARSPASSTSCGSRSSTCAARSAPRPASGSALSDYVRHRRRPLRHDRPPHPRRGSAGCAARSRPSCCASPRRR